MKQTVEEAAIESCVIDRSIYNDEYQPYYLDGFKDDAKWQSKQSPWISVKERLPEEGQRVVFILEWRGIHRGYFAGLYKKREMGDRRACV